MQPDVSSDLKDLEGTLTTIERVLDLDELDSRARELEDQAADPSLWDDPDHAQQVTSELSRVQAKLKKIRELRQRLEDLPVLYNMAAAAAAAEPAKRVRRRMVMRVPFEESGRAMRCAAHARR